MGLGIIGIEFFQSETQATLAPEQSIDFAGYNLTYKGLSVQDNVEGREAARAYIDVSKGSRNLGTITPRHDFYYSAEQTVTLPGLRSTLNDDLYIILVDWMPISSDGATFKIFHNPLINWLWIGSIVLMLGTLVALWPDADRKPALEAKAGA